MGGKRDMAWLWEWDPTTCTINKPNREAEPLVVKFRNKISKSEPLAVLLTFFLFVMDWMWFFRFRRGSFPRKDQLLVVLKSACLKIQLNDASFSQENAFTRQTRQLPLDRRDNSATKVQKEFLFLNIQIFTTQMAGKLLSLNLRKLSTSISQGIIWKGQKGQLCIDYLLKLRCVNLSMMLRE